MSPVTWRRRALAASLGLAVALLCGEAAVRVWGGEAAMMAGLVGRTTADLPLHRPSADPELLYELIPSLDRTVSTAEAALSEEEAPYADDPRSMVTNKLGFRDSERAPAKPPGVTRILCLGGSNTYGAAVSQGRTWPAQLQRALAERGVADVEVWNLGVDGYQTRQKLRLAERALAEWEPDLLLFQLANSGPRLVLDGMQRAPEPWLTAARATRDYGVYSENLHLFPAPGSRLLPLLMGSALARTVLVSVNRIHRSGLPGGDHPEPLVERAEARAGPQLATLVEEARPRTESVFFVPPAGGWPPWMQSADMPLVDLRDGELPDLPDLALLHPGAGVYAWYGEALADALIAGGCLGEGMPRCGSLSRTRDTLPR